MRTLFCAYFLLCSFSMSYASDIYNFENEEQLFNYHTMTKQLRCLVCANQTLSDSYGPFADEVKEKVYLALLSGQQPETIKQNLIHDYGEKISYDPVYDSYTWLLWLMPIGIFMFAVGTILLRVRFKGM